MNVTFAELLQQASQLKPEEQATLSGYLIDRLVPRDTEWEATWTEECERRIAACERGEMQTYDSDEVMAQLKAKHGLK